MKQKDIALIILVVGISAVISYLVSTKLFVTPNNRQQKVEDVQLISTNFDSADNRFFNKNSINPVKTIPIFPNQNTAPFINTTQ